jgi:uncharacterized protein YkwD
MAGRWLLPSGAVVALAVAMAAASNLAVTVGSELTHAAACEHKNAQPRQVGTRVASRAVICLINTRRTRHGLRKLEVREELNAAAREHSRYMKRHGCFSHQCEGEPDLGSRLRRSGYLGGSGSAGYGENIAWGGGRLGTPRSIVAGWMDSSGHRANILDRNFEHIGVGVAWGSPPNPRADAGLYTADFGYRG